MTKRKIYWVDCSGNRHFETIATEDRFRKVLDEVCDKARREKLSGHAKSEIIEE
jgi:hypothetical protein